MSRPKAARDPHRIKGQEQHTLEQPPLEVAHVAPAVDDAQGGQRSADEEQQAAEHGGGDGPGPSATTGGVCVKRPWMRLL